MKRTPAQIAKQIAAGTVGFAAFALGIDFAINVVKNASTKAEPAPIVKSANQFIGPTQPYQTIAAGYICANLEQGMDFENAGFEAGIESGFEAGIEMAQNHHEAIKALTNQFQNNRKTYPRKIIKAALAECPDVFS